MSGTVGAARMAAEFGVPGLALSLMYPPRDVEGAARVAAKLVGEILEAELRGPIYLNVNFPQGEASSWKKPLLVPLGGRGLDLAWEEVAGGESATAATASFGDARVFVPRIDRYSGDRPEASDSRAILDGHITVTPLAPAVASPSQESFPALERKIRRLRFFE